MSKIRLVLVGFIAFLSITVHAQDFPKPKKGAQVHDFAGILPNSFERQLEASMQEWRRANGAEIAVIIVNSVGAYDIAQYNAELAEKWGIGKSGEDNGVSFLVAVDDRKMNISTGYGVEEYITDALAKRIIETVIKPEFKANNYQGGIAKGVDAIQGLIEGIYSAEDFKKKGSKFPWWILPLIIIILFAKSRRGGGKGGRGLSAGEAILLGSMGARGFGSGGGFSSGGGGFGGFGGGSFGGGGASGSW